MATLQQHCMQTLGLESSHWAWARLERPEDNRQQQRRQQQKQHRCCVFCMLVPFSDMCVLLH
jgi:hypothetical protein